MYIGRKADLQFLKGKYEADAMQLKMFSQSVLKNLWDTKLRHLNVMLILCGSSISFMEKKF